MTTLNYALAGFAILFLALWIVSLAKTFKTVAINAFVKMDFDAFLYTLVGVDAAALVFFWSDDSYKYVNPYVLFWIKALFSLVNGGALALKMYRSDGHTSHLKKVAEQEEKKKAEAAEIINLPVEPPAQPKKE